MSKNKNTNGNGSTPTTNPDFGGFEIVMRPTVATRPPAPQTNNGQANGNGNGQQPKQNNQPKQAQAKKWSPVGDGRAVKPTKVSYTATDYRDANGQDIYLMVVDDFQGYVAWDAGRNKWRIEFNDGGADAVVYMEQVPAETVTLDVTGLGATSRSARREKARDKAEAMVANGAAFSQNYAAIRREMAIRKRKASRLYKAQQKARDVLVTGFQWAQQHVDKVVAGIGIAAVLMIAAILIRVVAG